MGEYKWYVSNDLSLFRRGHATVFICEWGLLLLCWCRYILVYPQGCDVCNHLSLFLCVADYDKLLPGDQQDLAAALQWVLLLQGGCRPTAALVHMTRPHATMLVSWALLCTIGLRPVQG